MAKVVQIYIRIYQRNNIKKWMFLTYNKIYWSRTSLVVQWLRIRLPMQGTRVRALVREDPTCRGATKPVCHNYWACALELASCNYWAWVPQLLKPAHLEPMHCNEEQAPLAAIRESPHTAMKTQHSQNKTKKKTKKKNIYIGVYKNFK